MVSFYAKNKLPSSLILGERLDGFTYQVWPSQLVCGHCIVQFDVQVLVHTLQRAAYAHFILEFDSDFGFHERLEKAAQ